ncbi:single-strand selective monofunctional uracil DNA glycosylase-like, partial [Centruroides sculpturatus]|uniref:single-strand selective monofunctional uracil DNA glycosylase-like n=1 Tax=Centruroides sculpturatus TaxID=218467 RepID=UPI000C6D5B07
MIRWTTHRMYLSKYTCGPNRILLLEINPGQFETAQNVVPFKEISTFFMHSLVHNYCSLSFLFKTRKIITPSQSEHVVTPICDEASRRLVNLLNVKILIAVGKYTERRAKIALRKIMAAAPLCFCI